MNIDAIQSVLWKFIRNDLSLQAFENWFHSNQDLEKLLGNDLYLELLLFDYQKNDSNKKSQSLSEIHNLKLSMYPFLSQTPCSCLCPMLPDYSWIDFYLGGYDQNVITKLEEFLQLIAAIYDTTDCSAREDGGIHYDAGGLHRCSECQQYWFMFYEYGHDYFLVRLNEGEAHALKANHDWPNVNWPARLKDRQALQKINFQFVKNLYDEFPIPPYQQFFQPKL